MQILPLRSGDYVLDDFARIGSQVTPGVGVAAGASVRAFTPLEDPTLGRRDVALGVKPAIIPDPLSKPEGLPADESNILFVDGLPNDCRRREVARILA